MKPDVHIIEVGPRDGLQNEAVSVSTATKVEYIRGLVAAGLSRIEAVSFVHPTRVPQMADAEAVMAMVPRDEGVSYSGLVLNERGMDRALDCDLDEVNFVLLATETFSIGNQGMSIADAVSTFEAVSARAHRAGLRITATIGAAFGCPFEGRVDPDSVAALARRLDESGPSEIALADTIGVGVPAQLERLVSAVSATSSTPLRVHLHNTRNTGYANALRAVELGVTGIDASSGGIGGCPFAPRSTGNIATEDLMYALETSGVPLGLNFEAVVSAQRLIGERLGKETPGLLSKAGWFPPGPPSS